ncbi:MAG: hypothetical protein WAM26_05355 [Nitrososphaeraceae archaeon]
MNRLVFAAIFATATILFSVDVSISNVADFLIPFTTSFLGISLFITLSTIFILLSFVLMRLIKNIASQIISGSNYFRILHYIVLATQSSLIGILIVILTQILAFSEYSTYLLALATLVITASSAAVCVISLVILLGWYRVNRSSYVALIFAVAFAFNIYIFLYLGITDTFKLAEKSDFITPDSGVKYATDTYQPWTINSVLWDTYRIGTTGIFILFLAGSAMILHHYASKIGRVKFWTLILLPTVYYSSTLVDTFGLYVPESDADFFNYYVYVSLNGVIGGVLLGFAFWTIAKAMRANKSVAKYLQLCSYGFVLNFIAGVGVLVASSYPPYGFVSFAMLTLSSYMIILGLYSTAISISQDIRLRQYIKDLSKADSGFLNTIGQAQMEKQVQSKASALENVVKEQRLELEKKSGIQSSVQQQDIKQYLLEVLQEVDKHKSAQ